MADEAVNSGGTAAAGNTGAAGASGAGTAASSAAATVAGDEMVTIKRAELEAGYRDRSDRAKESARKAMLAKAGVETEDQLIELAKKQREAEEASKTELERERGRAAKHEAASKKALGDLEAAQEESRRLRLYMVHGVKDTDVTDYLLTKAKAADPSLDEAAWFAKQRTERPALFAVADPAAASAVVGAQTAAGTAAQVPANSGVRQAQPAASNGAGVGAFDALKATPAELAAYATRLGLETRHIR